LRVDAINGMSRKRFDRRLWAGCLGILVKILLLLDALGNFIKNNTNNNNNNNKSVICYTKFN